MNEHGEAPINDTYLQLLLEVGADSIRHSGRTLLDHLMATCRLLSDWGNPAHVCAAGLFHSIYGTQTFGTRAIDYGQRQRVAGVIGQQSEQLVYLFGVCDRDTFFRIADERSPLLHDRVHNQHVAVAPHTLHALIEMEVANMLEQIPHRKRISPVVMDTYRRQCEAARRTISDAAYRKARQTFAEYNPATAMSL